MTTQETSQTNPQFDLDPRIALERVDTWLNDLVAMVPNLIGAILVVVLFYVLGALTRRFVVAAARTKVNLGTNLGNFARAAVIGIGGLIALTVVVPSFRLGDLIAGLGVGSVAIGFAFKDILQNWLAGMLLLLRQPFEIGDQIEVGGFSGTVERIESRATLIKTFDGQRVVIPNSSIYTSSIVVTTAFDQRRSEYDVGIGYGDDIDEACRVILEAVGGIEEIESDPAPQALPCDLAASWVTIRVRWWTDSTRATLVENQARAISAIKQALDKARIDMPFDTNVVLLHDQTESSDGNRAKQREGWPLPKGGDSTVPRASVREHAT